MLKEQLKINEWLELIKEDKNLNGAYICISQYLYLDEKEKQEIKKQLEDMTLCRDIASGHRQEVQDREVILLTQQKEFINFLKDEIERKRLNATCMFEYNDTVLPLKVILQKYKEIIGVSDENNKQ